MTQTAIALSKFWSSFDLPAFVEYHIPDDVDVPYITYELTEPHWQGQAAVHARVWYRDDTYEHINAKCDEIAAKIGDGITLKTESGMIALFKDQAFMQYQPYEDETGVKIAYLSLILQAYTN